MRPQPFLKWAGGKRWFVARYRHLFPRHFRRYFEPFLGGGAVFFSLRPSHALLSDTNDELIATYQALKNDWASVLDDLHTHAREHDDDYYYHVRAMRPHNASEQAARIIYLSRTCWNGLYRVNRRGHFNTPRGTRDSVIFDSDNFETVATVLKNAQLIVADFESVIDAAGKDDFVFIDPPYTVKHNHNGFQRYNETIFRWSDQERLAHCVERARGRGAMLLVTNAAHDSVRDLFGGLGNEFLLRRKSLVAGDPAKRSSIDEVATVVGYDASETEVGSADALDRPPCP